jgi:hypothetical protein
MSLVIAQVKPTRGEKFLKSKIFPVPSLSLMTGGGEFISSGVEAYS